MSVKKLNVKKQTKFFTRHLDGLPEFYSNLDSTRIVLTFFAVSGLDLLNTLDSLGDDRKKEIIDWIYNLQIQDDTNLISGFQGTTILNSINNTSTSLYKCGYIANTYSALCTLLALGDDFSRINRESIILSLRKLQNENGCFTAAREGTESDMRFVYCASCICYMLDDWTGMDVQKTINFILDSISYESAMGQGPELEAHGGPTYCGVASLVLMNRLDVLTMDMRNRMIYWLVKRQHDGFQGRPNKSVDSCYSFWIGATLHMLKAQQFINETKNFDFIMSTQNSSYGGFSKWVFTHPDPMHTYLALASLSLLGKEDLGELVPMLNISRKAFENLKRIHEKWHKEALY